MTTSRRGSKIYKIRKPNFDHTYSESEYDSMVRSVVPHEGMSFSDVRWEVFVNWPDTMNSEMRVRQAIWRLIARNELELDNKLRVSRV